MDINIFNDPALVPQPRDKIVIERLAATPYPDRHRVHVEVQVTMFLERPNLLLVLRNAQGHIVNELNVIATMHAQMEFTIHIRNVPDPMGDYTLDVEVFYETRQPPQDKKSFAFSIPHMED
ncbi:MAG: hypothetical protein MUE40_04940 [Anaerolineae bacterium]|nr:hypothetical protein [Anaerolineae bacterium]